MDESAYSQQRSPELVPCRRHWAMRLGGIGCLLGALSGLTVVDLDLFHEMALIREAIREGSIPRRDVFAYTPTVYPIVHHEWGTGAVLYAVCVGSGMGAAGLMLLRYALSVILAVSIYVSARRGGASEATFFVAVPLAIGMGWLGFTVIRAQFFTLVYLALLMYFLRLDQQQRTWWCLPWLALYVVWLNMHAGFLVGAGLMASYAVERGVRDAADRRSLRAAALSNLHMWALLLAMAVLVPMNPYGWDYVPYMWHAVRMARPLVAEWAPLWHEPTSPALWMYGLAVLLALYACWERGIRACAGMMLLLPPALLAFRHTRHLSLFAVVWLSLVPAWLTSTRLGTSIDNMARRRSLAWTVLWLTIAIMGSAVAVHKRFWHLRLPTSPSAASEGVPVYPAGAVTYLRDEGFNGNLMVPFDCGAFVSWYLYPHVKVSLDSRYEVAYPPGAVEETVAFYAAQGDWQAILAKYPTDALLVPWWSPLQTQLETSAAHTRSPWRRIYVDDAYAVFIHERIAGRYSAVDRRGKAVEIRFP